VTPLLGLSARRISELVVRLGDGWTVRAGVGSGGRVVVAERGDRRIYAAAASDAQVAALVGRSQVKSRSPEVRDAVR
jgi:hypothetical protein